MSVTCRGCGVEGQPKRPGHSLDDRTPEGWGNVADQSNGLEFFQLCRACSERVGELARAIRSILRSDYVHFRGMLKLGEKNDRR